MCLHILGTCCSIACQLSYNHWEGLVQKTGEQGFIKDKNLPEDVGITVNAGHDHVSPNSQTKVSIPAAKQLLTDFSQDCRHVRVGEGPPKVVKLIQSFVERTHPLKTFNNVYTVMVWNSCSSKRPHCLKVMRR